MQVWFYQANYMSFGAGGTGIQGPAGATGVQGISGLQGVTGFSPYQSGTLIVPALSIRDLDSFAAGTSKITTYRLHFDNNVDTASSTVDLLETTLGVRHNVYAELGKTKIYDMHSGTTGTLTRIQVENRTSSDMEVTYLKTAV